jgi:hypothetical protein
VHPCTGTDALYRPYGKVHRCTGTEALYRPYGKVHPCRGTDALYRPYGLRGSRGIALSFHDHGTRRGEGSASRSGRSSPRGKTRYPCIGGMIGRSGQVRKISPPPGFDSRTVQTLVSRYTDYATRPTWSVLITKYSEGYQIKKSEIDEVCSTCGGQESCLQCLGGEIRGKETTCKTSA